MGAYKIVIKDFQSIEKADFEIDDGLNIITGETNAGKTAIIRAIDEAIFNRGDDDHVRVGRRYSGVKIDNGHHVMVFRRDAHGKNEKTLYQFDGGAANTKVGRTQLPEVASMFNILDVRLNNGSRNKLNFWFQGAAPFLTDKTAGQLFEFLSQSSCDKYLKVTRQMESDIKDQKYQIERLGHSIDVLRTINTEKQEFLDKNAGFDDVYAEAIDLSTKVNTFNQIEDLISAVDSLKNRIKVKKGELKKVTNILDQIDMDIIKSDFGGVIQSDKDVSAISDVLGVINTKKKALDLRSAQLSNVLVALGNYQGIEAVPGMLSDIQAKQVVYDDIQAVVKNAQGLRTKIQKLSENLSCIETKVLENVGDMAHIIGSIQIEEAKISSIKTLIDEIAKRDAARDEAKKKYAIVSDKYERAVKEFNEFKKEIGSCPLCGSVLCEEGNHGE